MNKIKSIQIQNLHNNGVLYEVGKKGVHVIHDKSMEYEDSIYNLYTVENKEGKRIAFIENCPVLVIDDVPENQKPKQTLFPDEPKPVKFSFKKSLIELGADKQIATDYIKLRTKNKAADSLTAFNLIKTQLSTAVAKGATVDDCLKTAIDCSWRGFKAEWHFNKTAKETTNEQPKKLSQKF